MNALVLRTSTNNGLPRWHSQCIYQGRAFYMYVLNDYSIAWDVDAARPHGLVQRLLAATPRPRDLQDDALGGITDLVAVDPLVNLE